MRTARRAGLVCAAVLAAAGAAFGQAPSGASSPPATGATVTTKQLMLDMIHPASNEILLAVFRGGPKDDKDWAGVRRSAVTLAESANLLMMRGRARDQGDWAKDARMLADAGAAAYKAAQARDAAALAALTAPLDASCTACHKQYRPNVFPREGGSR